MNLWVEISWDQQFQLSLCLHMFVSWACKDCKYLCLLEIKLLSKIVVEGT